jgi:hypothetical protein
MIFLIIYGLIAWFIFGVFIGFTASRDEPLLDSIMTSLGIAILWPVLVVLFVAAKVFS